MSGNVLNALMLTSLGAAGTALGGLFVVVQPKFDFKKLGYLQGIAAGLMMSISFFDLFPESAEAVGFGWASLWFFVGVAFFAAVVHFIPEPDASGLVLDDTDADASSAGTSALDSTDADGKSGTTTRRSAAKRAAASSATDTASGPAGTQLQGTDNTNTVSRQERREARKKVLLSGLITALGIALHNFPEGVAVFLASMKSHAIGLSLAIAIAMHNIPEGVAVALPVYFATGSRWQGFKYAAVSGLAEPLAVVVLGVLFPGGLPKVLVDCLLAAVGGIMAFLSLHELMPLSMEHAGKSAAVLCLFGGMALMSANLHILHYWMGDEH